MKQFCVLVSGGGTNLQRLIDECENGSIPAGICAVISSKKGVYALERAAKHNIPAVTVARKDYGSKEEYDKALLSAIDNTKPDFLVLAGYINILSPGIIKKYQNKIINIHPALIPSFCGKGYYGVKVHQAALEYGVKVSGATVHFVDEGTDTGPIIFQKSVPVYQDDTPETLQQRVLEVEHELLPRAVKLLAADRIFVRGRRVSIMEE